VEQDNALEDATASTVRTALGYKTGDYKGFSAFVEMEDVHALGDEEYNLPADNPKQYSVVADPLGTELNQSYLQYVNEGFTARYGRQQILLDNQRFVGNVGWRQNQQTYDGVLLSDKSVENFEVTLAHITNVNGILGEDTNSDHVLFNAGYTGLALGKLSVYYYGLENQNAPNASTETSGVRLSGGTGIFLYSFEFANQADHADSTADIDADYTLVEIGAKFDNLTVKAGAEVLGAGGEDGFETPLATKHAFNGWADIFVDTPAAGLEDTYVSIGGNAGGYQLQAVHHTFTPDTGGPDYGTEVDLLISKKFSSNYTAGIKLARYDADSFAVDTDKAWLFLQASFN
ncbi:MAG TPA: alginate export family protein, partial [Gammaproteobacteria bacterium]